MTVSTWDLLKSLGFKEDHALLSDPPGGLSFDFGNFKLSACFLMNLRFRNVVVLSGVMSSSRTIGMVECEMPLDVESLEQGAAWVTWCLDENADDGVFKPRAPVEWLTEGRKNRHLLPWERERAAYEARPNCVVKHDWAKVALQNLSEAVAALDDETPVIFMFDGEVLIIRCPNSMIAMPAVGHKWPSRYSLRAAQLRRLPKRLMTGVVEFYVWDSALTIGNFRYDGAVELT